jgi:hypothetical protein
MEQKISKVLVVLVIALLSIIISCKQDLGGEPVLEFLTTSKYTYKNDSVAPGDSILFGLKCKWNGADALNKITVLKNDALIETIEINPIDEEGVAFGVKYEKSAEEKDSFVFELLDAASNMASLYLVLYSDTSKSDLREIAGFILGAQNNKEYKQLYSVSSYHTSYDKLQADTVENIQKKIDFVAAYNADNGFFIGAPATDFDGIYDFGDWVETDTTKFVAYNLSNDEYGVLNKTKIKDKYEASKSEQTTKAKNLTEGSIYLFKTQSNKYGVIRIISVIEANDGTINFDMKVQR